MKIDDSALFSYLVEHLQPLTKADPNLLAKYVAALLKNNKPKKELEILCVDKLLDFLGDESKPFVEKLFCAFEDGTILTYNEECETTVADIANTLSVTEGAKIAMCSGDISDLRNSSHPSYADTGMFCDPEEEGTDDEDDDRNHKHKRPASRFCSVDRDMQDCSFNKVNKIAINGHSMYDTNHSTAENLKCLNADHMDRDGHPKRPFGCDHSYGGPSNESQWGVWRGSSLFRGGDRFEHQNSLSQDVLGRCKGESAEPQGVHEQRIALDGLNFNLPTIPLGPSLIPCTSRSNSSRGNFSQSHWAGFGQFSGISNGSMDQALHLNGIMQGTKGFSTNAALGLTGGHSRCSDFEERGYCLRGDLCPMEHGANRIVVEDVQSLSQFNLPVTLACGRGMTLRSLSVATSSLSPYSSNLSIAARRDSNLPVVNEPKVSKGISTNNALLEPDVYDPDQPFLNTEQPAALVAGLKRLPSFRKDLENNEKEAAVLKRSRGQSPNEGKFERSLVDVKPQGLTPGQLVLNHINHIHQGESNAESSTRPRNSFLNQSKAKKRELVEDYEPQISRIWENHFIEKQERKVKNSGTEVGLSSFFQKEDRQHSTENISHMSGSKRNMGLGSERAQRTLHVSCIPSSSNRKEPLRAHFRKFGEVVDIRVPSQGDRAFVQFSRREDAEAALKSPEAVMGNRFIRLSWAKRDSLPILSVDDDLVTPLRTGRNMSIGLRDLGLLTQSSSKTKHQVVTVSTASEPVAFKTVGKASVPPVSLAALPKKQEELELMKEELRRKQEELAQKRDDFRRKLDRLSKQGGVITRLHGNQVSNSMSSDAKAEGRQSSNKQLTLETSEAGLDSSQKEISVLSVSIEKALSSTDSNSGPLMDPVKVSLGLTQVPTGSTTPLSQRGSRGHSPWPGGTGLPSQWGPVCYKLDNRTTAFHVLPPFPDGLSDVTSLKDHFSLFGDLSNVEVEDVDKKVQCFKVTFCTRSAAEQAFLQGRSYQGASLHFSWAPSSGTTTGASSTGNVQDSINDNSRQTFCEAPVELGSREVELPKNRRTLGGDVSRPDDLADFKVADGILEPGYSQVTESGLHLQGTNPTVNSAGAGSIACPYKVASSL